VKGRRWKRFHSTLCAWEARLAAGLLVAMVVLIFAGGVARLLGYPLNWAIDLATAFFAWACFLSADVAWRRNGLMSVDLLVQRLPPRAQRACRLLNLALIGAFLVYVAVAGTWLSVVSRTRSFQGMADVSYSWVTMSMPVGALLLLVTAALKMRAEWRGETPAGGVADPSSAPVPDAVPMPRPDVL
jgi:TRAP-type C4-dicarboxylate transport system permease small subunit